MNKPSLLNIAGAYSFLLNDTDFTPDKIANYAIKNNMGCIIITDTYDLPFSTYNATVIVYGTHLRKAFDMYHDLHGSTIRNIEETLVQSILSSIGDYTGKGNNTYILSVKEIIRKET